jgi:ankyrin repeat protein
MHYAATAGREEIVGQLLPKMENLDIKANNGTTPYQCAQIQGHEAIAHTLLKAGASNTLIPEPSHSDLNGIERRHKDNFATHLSSKSAASGTSAEEYQKYAECLILASAQGDVEGVLLCLSKGVSVAERDHEHHKTALHWAAENGYVDIALLLLEWGSSIAS